MRIRSAGGLLARLMGLVLAAHAEGRGRRRDSGADAKLTAFFQEYLDSWFRAEPLAAWKCARKWTHPERQKRSHLGPSKEPPWATAASYFRIKDGGPFAFAGLWERWSKGDEPIGSWMLLTAEANETVGPVHDPVTVILEPEDYQRWLDPRPQRPEGLLLLVRPFPGERMVASAVGWLGNDPRHDDPRCLEPLA